jgi:hypothetical protein
MRFDRAFTLNPSGGSNTALESNAQSYRWPTARDRDLDALRKDPAGSDLTHLEPVVTLLPSQSLRKVLETGIPATSPSDATLKACGAVLCEGEIHQRLLVAT